MNRHSRTFAAVALALGALPIAPLARAVDNPPTTPATVTASRYSGTTADIIWARATDAEGLVRGYEVFRDGTPLGIRDALSVYEKSLVPGRSYQYSIAAVDSAGQRSAPIRVTLNAQGSNRASAGSTTPREPTATPSPTPAPIAAPPTSQPTAGGPAAPTGLRASAYSGTAGEIFWQRPTVAGLRYEVSRDGQTLKVLDGLSYFDNALSPGRDYRYGVVAIDREGRRSAPASVTLRSQGTAPGGTASNPFAPVSPTAPAPTAPSAPSAPAAPAPVAAAPASPAGLRGEIYSSRAAEIFWQRPAVAGLRYEVSRDGQTLKVLDGLSYFDNAFPGGAGVTYAVVALDAQGRRSVPASVRLGARDATAPFAQPDPSGASVVARLGYERARSLADEIVSSRYLSLYTDVAPRLRALVENRGRDGVTESVACPGGGSADVTREAFALVGSDATRFNGGNFATRVDAKGCRIADRKLDGRLYLTEEVQEGLAKRSAAFGRADLGALTIDAGTKGKVSMIGFIAGFVADDRSAEYGSDACKVDGRDHQTVEIERATLTRPEGTFSIGPSRIESEVYTIGRTPAGTRTDACFDFRQVAFETLGPNPAGRVPETGGPVVVRVSSPVLGGSATFSKIGASRRDERSSAQGGLGNTFSARLDATFGDGSTVRTQSSGPSASSVTIGAGGVTASFTDGYAIGIEPLPNAR